ncbi:hypothetical protein ACFFSH_12095 [Streptomyces filamentosus]|uniref:Uncharacterized protein n=1 Tax=Streptomyces filamentosus TaxID=67294 RepID=A0A919BXA5_STRFL|nr:hypothetical protein [Streptomyces filamentosus]GHG21117.1 hypothetical protein GCM10017667_65640 [Streptomyces filamentosus]
MGRHDSTTLTAATRRPAEPVARAAGSPRAEARAPRPGTGTLPSPDGTPRPDAPAGAGITSPTRVLRLDVIETARIGSDIRFPAVPTVKGA